MTSGDFTTISDQSPSIDMLQGHIAAGQAVKLHNCNLQNLDLGELNFSDWVFEKCTLTGASFTGSTLERTTFLGCRAAGGGFYNAMASEMRIDGGDFSNTKFGGARLDGATIARCKMTGADFSDAKADGLALQEVLLVLALLPKISFRDAVLKQVDFTEADLRACDFRDAVFEDCSLRDAQMSNCRFERADLRRADLGGVKLTDAKRFKGAIISKRQAGELLGQLGLQVL